jgi:hypothetical protein
MKLEYVFFCMLMIAFRRIYPSIYESPFRKRDAYFNAALCTSLSREFEFESRKSCRDNSYSMSAFRNTKIPVRFYPSSYTKAFRKKEATE